MLIFFVALQILSAILLILLTLVQPGNKNGAGAAFGASGVNNTLITRKKNTSLTKVTLFAVIIFMTASLCLSIISTTPNSVLSKISEPVGK